MTPIEAKQAMDALQSEASAHGFAKTTLASGKSLWCVQVPVRRGKKMFHRYEWRSDASGQVHPVCKATARQAFIDGAVNDNELEMEDSGPSP